MSSSLDRSAFDLKDQMKPYALAGLGIAFVCILASSMLVSWQMTGSVSLQGILLAQASSPVLWILDLLSFLLLFQGRVLRLQLLKTTESILEDKTEELQALNANLARQLNYESNYDAVTKLPNQSQLLQKINQALENARENESIAVIGLTIKGFKELNYNFGNYHANTMLRQFAEKLKKLLVMPFMLDPKMGIGFLAHPQGNEFALLIPAISKDIDIESLLKEIVSVCKTECNIDDNLITITPLASAALYPVDGDTADILLHRANVAMFHAKKESKGYAVYLPGMEDSITVNRTLLEELKKTIDREDLEIYYQPTVELATGKIIGAEALIRFHNSEFAMLNPEKLIPLVQGMNLMKQLTGFVLRGAIRQLSEWRRQGYSLSISVNLSAADVIDTELPRQIQQLLEEYQLPPEVLKVELTEHACLKDQAKTLNVLNALAKMGIKISIEDFCGGYYSFGYLMNFPISEVKIDKSFVMPMMTDRQKWKMVMAIVKLADVMGMDVYAIGVEDKAIADDLQAMGCIYGQGFYFSRAVNASDFTHLLEALPNTSLLNATRSGTDSLPI